MDTPSPVLPFAGFGFAFILIALIVYLAIIALMVWIGYLIMRTAVKNGVLLAMQQSGRQFAPVYPPQPPQPPYPGAHGPRP